MGSDHGDELVFVFGICFGNAHVKTSGKETILSTCIHMPVSDLQSYVVHFRFNGPCGK